jgi:hypothetical protein
MAAKNSFFIIDGLDVPEDERRIHCICVECVEKEKIENAWFWEGSRLGYSNYLYKCEKCGEIIYKPEENAREISRDT